MMSKYPAYDCATPREHIDKELNHNKSGNTNSRISKGIWKVLPTLEQSVRRWVQKYGCYNVLEKPQQLKIRVCSSDHVHLAGTDGHGNSR